MGVSGEKLRLVLLLELLFTSYFASCFDVTLLHTNDVHARVEETSVHSGKCDPGGECYAGVARRLTQINSIRKTEQNVLLLDAGDQYQGTIWFNYFKGDEAAHFMNWLKYDAMALGNHEFDNGMEGLISPFLQKVNCSVLSANMKPDQELADKISGLVLPYKIFTLGSEKVAVVGYTTKETPTLSTPGPNVVFQDEVQALQVEVDKLKTLGINKIIALGHSGFETDKLIAKKVSGVDVVIGGHSNTFLYTGIRVVFDLSKAPGHRVKKLDVLCTKCRVPYYEPLDINKTYKVVIPSYVADGGDGFAMIKAEKLKHDTGDQDISVVSDYISAMKKVYPAVEGRILFSGSVPTGLLSKAHLKMVLLSLVFYLASIV
ncbi:UNVERIFIED_CONTAM: hypothetical protein FKN15_040234 [Acipenser sinensis]